MVFFRAISMLIAVVALVSSPTCTAQNLIDGFEPRMYTDQEGANLPYRLFVPGESVRTNPLPLIVFLHGAGGAGTDNLKQISGGNAISTHTWTTTEMQARHPAFVLAPQLPPSIQWGIPESDEVAPLTQQVLNILVNLSKEFLIDSDRIYLIGQSRGGVGTWDLISKRPELFAAAVPLAGRGNISRVTSARSVPIWAFHGAKDNIVSVSGSRDLVAALRADGSSIIYTEYPEAGHNVWDLAMAETDLAEWLFSQSLANR